MEASEFMADVSNAHFWNFVTLLGESSGGVQNDLSDRDQYERLILGPASKLLSSEAIHGLKFSLSIREKSPAVQMHLDLSSDACDRTGVPTALNESDATAIEDAPIIPRRGAAWAIVGADERLALSASLLRSEVDAQRAAPRNASKGDPAVYAWDHVFAGGTADSAAPIVILHGAIGTPAFQSMHTALEELAQAGIVVYVLRHFTTCEAGKLAGVTTGAGGGSGGIGFRLQGYGVELAIKNMEYIAVDDSKVSSSDGEQAGAEADTKSDGLADESSAIDGFIFETLMARRPDLHSELSTLRDSLLAYSTVTRPLKEWELKDLGLQAAQKIAKSSDALRLMRDMSQNLPNLALSLTRIGVDAELRDELENNQQRYFRAGVNHVFLNGRSIDSDSIDPFKLLDIIRDEVRVSDAVATLHVPVSALEQLAGAAKALPTLRLDIRSPLVFYANDLETDKRTTRWPSSYYELLAPTWPGQFKQIRRNVYTVIFVLDAADDIGLSIIDHIAQYVANVVPVRFGFMLIPVPAKSETFKARETQTSPATRDAATAAACALAKLSTLMGSPTDAHELLEKEGDDLVLPGDGAPVDDPAAASRRQPGASSGTAGGASDSPITVSEAVARVFAYLLDVYGKKAALEFITVIAREREVIDPRRQMRAPPAIEDVEAGFEMAISTGKVKAGKTKGEPYSDVVAGNSEWAQQAAEVHTLLADKGLAALPLPLMFVNGKLFSGPDVEQRLYEALQEDLQHVQALVQKSVLTDSVKSLHDFLLEGSGTGEAAVKRYNPLVFASEPDEKELFRPPPVEDDEEGRTDGEDAATGGGAGPDNRLRFVNLAELIITPPLSQQAAEGEGASPPADPSGMRAVFNSLLLLHHPASDDQLKTLTHLVVADFATEPGRSLLSAALDRLAAQEATTVRVGLVSNQAPCGGAEAAASIEAALGAVVARVVAVATSAAGGSPPSWTGTSDRVHPFLQRLMALHSAVLTRAQAAGSTPSEAVDQYVRGIKKLISKSKLPSALSKALTGELDGTAATATALLDAQQKLAGGPLGLRPGHAAIITNGRVVSLTVGADGSVVRFDPDDFALLETYEAKQRADAVKGVVDGLSFDKLDPDSLTSDWLSTVVMGIVSVLGTERAKGPPVERQSFPDTIPSTHSGVRYENANSPLKIIAIINPLTPAAQKLAPVLMVLRDTFRADITMYLNPYATLSEMPINNFYRYVILGEPQFDSDGSLAQGPSALFTQLPQGATLTCNMGTPESWLVQSTIAVYDMDNIRLSELPVSERTVYAEYELEKLVVTGHCYDIVVRQPPRGLQLVLGNDRQPHAQDTLVMSNLGYFQLKALPGVWSLSLAHGRASKLYRIVLVSIQGHSTSPRRDLRSPSCDGSAATPSKSAVGEQKRQDKMVMVNDFKGVVVVLWVTKRPGMEAVNLLDEANDEEFDEAAAPDQKPTIWNKIQSYWADGKEDKDDMNAAVNVFSIASGHLYERFLKIMCLAVLKRTRGPVKFWFIKNYLSPKFKDFMPSMARHYNFSYELVTYKWPSWLHKQTEKQRLIWAYKILFLDVLFPIKLKKVIFVDADQVVRSDMRDLWEMDLDDNAIAMTPFCDSNHAVDGYRFWAQGFWKDHLRGKPYHISALFVVDLMRLRQQAAGDQYRVIYEQLSKDPNSLANLDQDLPNFAQHQVPIFSLPTEWLWCETWCDQASKATARTIDLCNNPMTKEPKLDVAKRIIPEWVSLDNEVKALEKSEYTAKAAATNASSPPS